jgi:hypothetical protein
MCGLVGVINTTSVFRVDFDKYFKQALICDSVRGDHSTGIFTVSSKLEGTTIKKAVDPSAFLDLPSVTTLLAGNNRLLMGHNRYATKGAIGDETAHPFTHGDITLAHNGTLYGHRNLTHRTDFDVDSEAVCYLLSISENVPKALEKLDGAYALTWYDARSNTFNIARNKERKLYIAKVNDTTASGAYLYASEVGMLMWLAARNNIRIEQPYIVPEGTILTWTLDGKAGEPKEEKFTPKESFDYDYRGGRVVYYNQNWNRSNSNSSSTHINLKKNNQNNSARSNSSKDERGLFGKVVDATFLVWEAYSPCNPYGSCTGLWDDDVELILGGILESKAGAILGAPTTKVKINGVNSEGKYFCGLHYESPKESNESSVNIDSLEKQLLEAEEEMSNNKKKDSNGSCKNCDNPLDFTNTFVAWNNEKFCTDCKEMHPEAIF